LQRHGIHTAFGIAWAAAAWWLNPSYAWWLGPVAGALAVSIPLSVFTSRASLGARLRRAGLFLIPEETTPPPEIDATQRYAREAGPPPTWRDAVVDPACNALMIAFAVPRPALPASARAARQAMVDRGLAEGPDALSDQEKNVLLGDREALTALHRHVVASSARHPAWLGPGSAACRLTGG
jgi:membrane glycosyltransferase